MEVTDKLGNPKGLFFLEQNQSLCKLAGILYCSCLYIHFISFNELQATLSLCKSAYSRKQMAFSD